MFPIENIKLWKRGSQWPFPSTQDVKFDLVISRSTFQHFVDPVGTLGDTYNFVRSEGYLIADILRWDLSYIAHCFEGALYGLHDGCVGHALSLVAVGGSAGLNIPAAYTAEDNGNRYTWLTDKGAYIDSSTMNGVGARARDLAEYLITSNVVEVKFGSVQDAIALVDFYKSRGLYLGEVPTDAQEIIKLAQRVYLETKYLSCVR